MRNNSIHVIPGQTVFNTDPVPKLFYLSAITQSQNALATFTVPHDYTVGEYISFRVSQPYGMTQINNMRGLVTAIGTMTVNVDIDTSQFNPFVYPVSGDNTPPFTVPAGSGIIPGFVPTVNLEDAFDNLPPGASI